MLACLVVFYTLKHQRPPGSDLAKPALTTIIEEFQASPEKIPSNILAERLKRLEHEAVVQRELYQERPPRYSYHLTAKGQDLAPVLKAIMTWGSTYLPGALSKEEIEKLFLIIGVRPL